MEPGKQDTLKESARTPLLTHSSSDAANARVGGREGVLPCVEILCMSCVCIRHALQLTFGVRIERGKDVCARARAHTHTRA